MRLKRLVAVAAAGLALATSSGCDLGRRINGAPGPNGGLPTPTASTTPRPGTAYETNAGFPLEIGFLAPGFAASFKDDKQYRIAPPGRHYVTIEVTFTNPIDDRPAPFLLGQPPRAPRLLLAVPVKSASVLGIACTAEPAFAAVFPSDRWCPLEVRLAKRKPDSSPLNIEVLPPSGSATDYYYSAATYADKALSAAKVSEWDLAVQNGPSSFVAVRTSQPGTTSSPSALPTP